MVQLPLEKVITEGNINYLEKIRHSLGFKIGTMLTLTAAAALGVMSTLALGPFGVSILESEYALALTVFAA